MHGLERIGDDSGNEDNEYARWNAQRGVEYNAPALFWWCMEEHRQQYPRLSQMALDILSVPAMSDEPERVFSGARRQISWERMRLGPETVEQSTCLKSWIRAGIVNQSADVDDIH